ncbi:lycopene beta-cyclase [Novosphingobium kunmingense]|uniref:Lycopene beta-cyclase n=1 Tax=Novosphingobium kunmingense TaxID=1211806 RepID=A0A2N0I497_9SPHN|nr:lycopene beta-cyclase CrtY [Novosphingobium kunmingense]PKB26004.1 lycopene beta-cyclase [Novosphingobium kunmingense]
MNAALPVVIVGGGLAGALAALCLAQRRPDVPMLLLEADERFGGNHTWSFFDSDVPEEARDLIAALNPVRWPRHTVAFPGRRREFDFAYNAVTSGALDALVRDRLPRNAWRTGAAVASLDADGVTLASGERIAALGVIDARGPDGPMPGLDLGWQCFVGIEFAARAPDPSCATVMDATLPQIDGYRFVYVLPMADDKVLVEDTYYTDGPDLDVAEVADRVRTLAAERGLSGPELRQEHGVLPILIGGDPDAFWPKGDPIPRLGMRGGFFHATTGYSFGLALQNAVTLSRGSESFDSAALAEWSRGRFERHWQAMRFFRVLNRMLFRAAPPLERYRVFEHFYRLPIALVARFYGGVPTAADKLRILSGKPPVAIGAALKALLGR